MSHVTVTIEEVIVICSTERNAHGDDVLCLFTRISSRQYLCDYFALTSQGLIAKDYVKESGVHSRCEGGRREVYCF